jgi:hypothetical protein
MPTYPFLSDEWLDEADRIRAEFDGRTAPIPHPVRMNLVVTEVPFSTEHVLAHVDTSDGELRLGRGHVAEQDLTVTVDYETAKAILVDQNAGAGMQAFMAGKVRIDGDMAKLMVLQSTAAAGDPAAAELAARLRAITD